MNKYPIEKYLLNALKKCHYNIDTTINVINAKYPFFRENDLRTIIADLFIKKINNYKIGGKWEKVEKKWKLVSEKEKVSGTGFEWSGPEWPASQDTNSLGPARNTYTNVGDRPSGKTPKNKKVKEVKPIEELEEEKEEVVDNYKKFEEYDSNSESENDMQKVYNDLYDKFSEEIPDDNDLNKILLEELKERGYGERVKDIKLKKREN